MTMDAIKVTGVAVDQQQVLQSALTSPLVSSIGDYASQLAQVTGASRGGPGLGFENTFIKIANNLDRSFRLGNLMNPLVNMLASTKAWRTHGAV